MMWIYFITIGQTVKLLNLTDEETEYLSSLLDKYSDIGDESDHFDMIFTEKEDQSKYINFHPKKESEE